MSIKEDEMTFPERAYRMLSWSEKWKEVTVRDDQFDFPWLLDMVQSCRRRKSRFRLIDSGKMDASRLEWLAEAGADFYTSDLVRPRVKELESISKSCIRGGAITGYFHHGVLESEPEKDSEKEEISFSNLMNMGMSGVFLFFSNREKERSLADLNELASVCQKGKSWLVYYHHGPLEPSLEELARNGAWIHVSHESLREKQDVEILRTVLRSAASKGAGLVLHLGEGWKASSVMDLGRSGAFLLFRSFHSGSVSLSKYLDRIRGKKEMDFRSYYLYHEFFL